MADEPRFALVVHRDTYEIGCLEIADACARAAAGTVFLFANEGDILPAVMFNTPRICVGDPGDENDAQPI